jgi:UTP--glucose-1-phosphate uridylyltransferase
MNERITKAVIPAAGLGTRFLPATKAMPKEMLPVVDKPAIQYVVEEAVSAGLVDVLMVTGRNKNALENHFDRVAELEATLKAKGDDAKLRQVNASTGLAAMHYVRRAIRWGSAMPCTGRGCTSGTSRSPCCSATTSSTRATRSCGGCSTSR